MEQFVWSSPSESSEEIISHQLLPSPSRTFPLDFTFGRNLSPSEPYGSSEVSDTSSEGYLTSDFWESFEPNCTLMTPSRKPLNLQATKSLLIKESLKIAIESKRREKGLSLFHDLNRKDGMRTAEGLREETTIISPDDEVRRNQRRERNKIAATKCRLKKKAHVRGLLQELQQMESTRKSLMTQINFLENQQSHIQNILKLHYCRKEEMMIKTSNQQILSAPSSSSTSLSPLDHPVTS